MKQRIAVVVIVCALGACTGKKAATSPEPPPPSPCAVTARHATELMRTELGDALDADGWAKANAVLEQRCTADAWSADAMACMDRAQGEEQFDVCADQLTDAQNQAVKDQFEREIVPLVKAGAMEKKEESRGEESGEAAAPPPPDDPCGGGP